MLTSVYATTTACYCASLAGLACQSHTAINPLFEGRPLTSHGLSILKIFVGIYQLQYAY